MHIEDCINAEQEFIECPKCHHTAQRVKSTQEEIQSKTLNCGRSYACCCRAFFCSTCNERITARAESPEWDLD